MSGERGEREGEAMVREREREMRHTLDSMVVALDDCHVEHWLGLTCWHTHATVKEMSEMIHSKRSRASVGRSEQGKREGEGRGGGGEAT